MYDLSRKNLGSSPRCCLTGQDTEVVSACPCLKIEDTELMTKKIAGKAKKTSLN